MHRTYGIDSLRETVADLCIMLALLASRNAGPSMKIVREGEVRDLEAALSVL